MRTQVRTGTTIGRFRVIELLGEGAMGAVCLAEDTSSAARVALKLLGPELSRDDRFRQRFLRESELAASLDHPNVVRVLASGEHDGVLYLAMAYVEGADLRELLRHEGRLEPTRALSLVEQVADALDVAHASGLVHRDVKPGNILVAAGPDGEHAFVCDFGLARHVSSVGSLTGDRGFVGTVDYIPPEQIEGGPIDGRADVYSLGCVLFECLAGERPFDRESELSVVFAHLNEPPPRLSDLRPELPEAFDGVFATALAKAPADRYSTCSELIDAGRAALRGKALPRRRRGRRRLLVAAAILAVSAGGVTGGLLATRVSGTGSAPIGPAPLALPPNSLGLIDMAARRVVAHVGLGERGSLPNAGVDVVASGRFAWVLTVGGQRLQRIDLASRRIDRTIRLPWAPSARIASGGGMIWATQDGGPGVLGIDAHTGRVTRRFTIPGGNGIGIAYGDGSLWLAQGAAVARIDPRSGRVLRRIGERPGQIGEAEWLTFANGSLWGARPGTGSVRKFDPVANQVVANATLHGWVSDLAVANREVWLSIAQDGALYRLSEDDLSVEGTVSAGPDPERLSVGAGRVWAANAAGRAVSSVSPAAGTRQEVRTVSRPETLINRGRLLLVASGTTSPPLAPVQGEEIRISLTRPRVHLDPATPISNPEDPELRYAICANLLGYPDTSGPAGGRLRPEVAAAMPEVSPNGRTYTFRIQPGFRFSPPSNEPVTAGTFKHTFERALAPAFNGWGNSFVRDIVGERAFQAGEAKHISGLVASGHTLRITLTHPDGAFLTGISQPPFCPVPRTLPIPRHAPSQYTIVPPVPSDGPYYVASSTTDRTVLLRNPNYPGTRPRRPARIVFLNGLPTPQAVGLVDRGNLDYLPQDGLESSLLSLSGVLDRRYGPGSAGARAGDQRYIHTHSPGWDGLVLNASRPLFRDVRLRRAVEYALDRRALAAAFFDLPSDRIVPPAVPGFGTTHRYPATGADLKTARRLAGTRPSRAVLYFCTNGIFGSPAQRRVAVLVREQLARIGISVTITQPRCAPEQRYDARSLRADLIMVSVFNPLRDPSAFVEQILRTGTYGAALGRGTWNDQRFLARVRRARALRGDARRAAYRRLEDELLRAAPVAVYGSYYGGGYFSRRVGCRVVPPGVGAVDLGALCKRA
jgi:ABC-type transport system substrate-binding protein